jgi:hypothetical protein
LVDVQPVGVLLKFSFISTAAVLEFDVALDVKFTELPEQIVEALVEAETDVGIGLTVRVATSFVYDKELTKHLYL